MFMQPSEIPARHLPVPGPDRSLGRAGSVEAA